MVIALLPRKAPPPHESRQSRKESEEFACTIRASTGSLSPEKDAYKTMKNRRRALRLFRGSRVMHDEPIPVEKYRSPAGSCSLLPAKVKGDSASKLTKAQRPEFSKQVIKGRRGSKKIGEEHKPVSISLEGRYFSGNECTSENLRQDLKQSSWKEALDRMEQPGIHMDNATCASLLRRCGNAKALSDCKRVHAYFVKSGYMRDKLRGNLLVQMYGKCGALDDARRVFDRLRRRNVFSWTIMIGAYAQHGHVKEAFQLFQEMQLEGVVPDKVTFASILEVCASQAALAEGKRIHACIVGSGLESDVVVGTALVNMYGKCGSLEDARRIFDKMPERNVVSWTAMIAVYAQHGRGQEALQLFQQMYTEGPKPDRVTFASTLEACASQAGLAEGKLMHACVVDSGLELDVVVGTAIVNMYGKCGSLQDARRMFDKMPKRDVVSWTAMIGAYAQHGQVSEAVQVFQQMQGEGVVPNRVTFVSILNACANQAALAEGKRIHTFIVGSEMDSDVVVGNALISMYGKCGSLEEAWIMFDKMPERDVVSWTAIIAAFAQHGQGKEVFPLFQQMQLEGVMADKVTFISILSACSHAGLVDEGCHCFVSMGLDHGITLAMEHYNCMIDLLGRVGWLDEGEDLIHNMPFQPSDMSWMTLLGACRMHFDVERGKRAAEHLLELKPGSSASYVSLSNIYAAAGMWDDVAKTRGTMEEKGL